MTKPHGVCHDTIPFFMERFMPAYAEQIRRFIGCLKQETPPLVDGNDARKALEIGLAAIRSHQEQRSVLLSELRP